MGNPPPPPPPNELKLPVLNELLEPCDLPSTNSKEFVISFIFKSLLL
jgi:hypothetical protein